MAFSSSLTIAIVSGFCLGKRETNTVSHFLKGEYYTFLRRTGHIQDEHNWQDSEAHMPHISGFRSVCETVGNVHVWQYLTILNNKYKTYNIHIHYIQ